MTMSGICLPAHCLSPRELRDTGNLFAVVTPGPGSTPGTWQGLDLVSSAALTDDLKRRGSHNTDVLAYGSGGGKSSASLWAGLCPFCELQGRAVSLPFAAAGGSCALGLAVSPDLFLPSHLLLESDPRPSVAL